MASIPLLAMKSGRKCKFYCSSPCRYNLPHSKLADFFLHSYEAYVIQWLLKKNEKKLARSFNFIYPIELEIKDTTDTAKFASQLGLHLAIDNDGRLRTKFYDKRDDFKFLIVKFPFICTNILAAPPNEEYISQFIRYSRTCGSYHDFLDRWLLLTRKLPYKGFLVVRLLHGLARVVGVILKYLVVLL